MRTKKETPAARSQKIQSKALSYPESHEDHPWGEIAIKVRKKVFLFLSTSQMEISISVKLPESNVFALMLPEVSPTGYGLGNSGWITAKFPNQKRLPLEMIEEWIEESYRAIAPKGLIKRLDERSSLPSDLSEPNRSSRARKK